MKGKHLLIILVIFVLIISNVCFILKYMDQRAILVELSNNNDKQEKTLVETRAKLTERIYELEEELSKYDPNYKSVVDITFDAELKEIITENGKTMLKVNGKETEEANGLDGDFYLQIDDEKTQIIKADETLDKSALSVGQNLKITFSDSEKENYPSTLLNITKVEVVED